MEEGQELQEASEAHQATGIPVGMARVAGLVVKEDTWEVERTVRINGKETTEREAGKIVVHPFITQPEVVGVSYGVTVNLGNFNSGRASVWRSRPCYTAEVEECYRLVSDWAGEKITEEQEALKRLRDKLGGGGGGSDNR